MMRSTLVLLILLGLSFNIFGTDPNTEKDLNAMYDKAWDLLPSNVEASLQIADEMHDLALDDDNLLALVKSYYVTGYAYYLSNRYDKAAFNYFAGLDVIQKEGLMSKIFRERELLLFQNIGLLYEKTYGNKEALDYYTKAIEIAEEIDSRFDIAVLNYNIGVINFNMKDYENAENNFQTALDLYVELDDKKYIAQTYNLFGVLRMEQGEYEQANEYYKNAITLCEKHNFLETKKSWYISNLGESFFDQKEYDSAKYFYNQALLLSEKLDDVEKIQWINNNLGDVYYQEGNYQKAIDFYQTSIALGNTGIIDDEYKRSSKNISEAYEMLGDYKNALAFNDQYIHQAELLEATKDKLAEQNAQYRMREVEWMLELQAQQARISAMQAANFWFKISMSILFIVLVYSAYKSIRYYRGIRAAKKLLLLD